MMIPPSKSYKHKHGFDRNKIVLMDGRPIVYYTHGSIDGFTIAANITGLKFSGTFEMEDVKVMQEFAEIVSDAWTDVLIFRNAKKITLTSSGH